jgi:hypothetical protein
MLSIGFCKEKRFQWDRSIRCHLAFRDRFRTAINVFGDSIGCAIVQHLSRKELVELAKQEMKEPSVDLQHDQEMNEVSTLAVDKTSL